VLQACDMLVPIGTPAMPCAILTNTSSHQPVVCCTSAACVSHSHFTSQHQPGRSHLLLLLRLVLLTLQQRKHAVLVVEIS
jgi:hypothetical protein